MENTKRVILGCENLIKNYRYLIEGKKLGIICNQTSVMPDGTHIVDELSKITKITAIFAPEHGFHGKIEDQAIVHDDKLGNIPVYSLFGDYLTPTRKMLQDVDLLIYDIQDVGVRFYTFISNLFLAMHACKRDGISLLILDRPNPINANIVNGPIMHPSYTGFLGVLPIPIRYGMTVGELGLLFNAEQSIGFKLDIDVKVIPMIGYKRDMWFSDTGIKWIPTSPCMPTEETTLIYPGTCLFEGTNISEGRGTNSPFLVIGAPFIEPEKVIKSIPQHLLKGIKIEESIFIPQSMEGVCTEPKYKNRTCYGLKFKIEDKNIFEPIQFTVALLTIFRKLYPKDFQMRKFVDQLWGSEDLRSMIEEDFDYSTIILTTLSDLETFKKIREKYLIYK